MGGGDLNMKKHFHPLTMQNLERVWKAEQKAKEEAEKLEQLQRELEEERRREALQQHAVQQGIVKKKNEKLDWMYAGHQVNHEEYLLGRKIDKNVEILKEADDTPNEKPGASFVMDISDPVKDMASKIKEDPLFLIRKKEEESKKELVQNPIKLRKLKEMLNLSVKEQKKGEKSKKSKHKKDKRERKERKRRYGTDGSSEEDYREEDRRENKKRKNYYVTEYEKEKNERKGRHGTGSNSDGDNREDKRIGKKTKKNYYLTENGYDSRKRHRIADDGMEIRRKRDRSRSFGSDDSGEIGSRGRRHDSERRKDTGKREREHHARREEHHKGRAWEKRKDGRREQSREDRPSGRDTRERVARKSPAHKRETSERKYPQKNSSSEDETDSHDDKEEKSRNDCHFNGHASGNDRPSGAKGKGLNYGLYHPKAGNDVGNNERKTHISSKEPRQRSMERSQVKDVKVKGRRRHDSSSESSTERHHSKKNGHITEIKVSSYNKARDRKEDRKANAPPPRMTSDVSRKFTQEEMEKKRQEMMENAKWRDDQRGKNIKKYKMEEEKEANEEKRRAVSPDSKAKFIHDLQVKSYSSSQTSSVEDRIKRNIYTKQRTRDALGKKFTEK